MADYVVCPLALYPRGPSAILVYQPKVYLYASEFAQQTRSDPATGVPVTGWTLVRVDTWKDRAAAESDPDVIVLPPDPLETKLGNRATTLQTALTSKFSITATLDRNDTIRETLVKIGVLLDPAFDEPTFTAP